MTRALLKQALDALNQVVANVYDETCATHLACEPAITALQSALAQPEPDPAKPLTEQEKTELAENYFAARKDRGTWLDEECMEEEITDLRAALVKAEAERDALRAANVELYGSLKHLTHNARKSGADMGLALDFAHEALAAMGAPEVRRARPDDTEGGEL